MEIVAERMKLLWQTACAEAVEKGHVLATLGRRAVSDFELRPRRLSDIDPQAPQVELELVVLAVFFCCAVHALLARRFRSFFAALPFVLICNSLLSSADGRVPVDVQPTSGYAADGFTLTYRSTPFYVFVARAAMLYLCDASARVVYHARLLALPVSLCLALLTTLPLEILCFLGGWSFYRAIPDDWSLQWSGVPLFTVAVFWICLQAGFTLAHEIVDFVFPRRVNGIGFLRIMVSLLLATAGFIGSSMGITRLQMWLRGVQVSDGLVLAAFMSILVLLAGAAAGRAKPRCNRFAFVLPALTMAFVLGSAGSTCVRLCTKAAAAETTDHNNNSAVCTPDGRVAFAFVTTFAASLFALPLLSGQRIDDEPLVRAPLVSSTKPITEPATADVPASSRTPKRGDTHRRRPAAPKDM